MVHDSGPRDARSGSDSSLVSPSVAWWQTQPRFARISTESGGAAQDLDDTVKLPSTEITHQSLAKKQLVEPLAIELGEVKLRHEPLERPDGG